MKVTFIAPAHSDAEETQIVGEAEIVGGRIKLNGDAEEWASANPALPGRVDLNKLSGDDAELWLRGLLAMAGGFGIVPVGTGDLDDTVSEEEIARLKKMVGSKTEAVEKRAPNVPNRLTRP